MKKRIISVLLVIVLAVSLFAIPSSAASWFSSRSSKTTETTAAAPAAPAKTEYTTVLVHGLMGWGPEDGVSGLVSYWGLTSEDIVGYLTNQGYDVVDASVGPLSSCWDRCCELFAQLTGTRTDYGAAHAAKCEQDYANANSDLKHDRYGRDYTGAAIVDNWGPIYENGKVTGWNDTKLNLIGHSFGGPTIVGFLNMLAEGNQDEINWGKEQAKLNGGDWHDYVSPLFWGDYNGEYLINSLTSLAGVLNGTSFLSFCGDDGDLMAGLVVDVANILGVSDYRDIFDFQLEQFGITTNPNGDAEAFVSELKRNGFLDGYDNAFYDLSISGCNQLKQGWKTYDNVYYFGYAGDKTVAGSRGVRKPDIDMAAVFSLWSYTLGSKTSNEKVLDINGNVYGTLDKTWFNNDGIVNTISARYPLGAANKPYDANNIQAGIWQWKDEPFDHFQFNGSIFNMMPTETRTFYLELMHNLDACKGINRSEDGTAQSTTSQAAVPVTEDVGSNSLFQNVAVAVGAATNTVTYGFARAINGISSLFKF